MPLDSPFTIVYSPAPNEGPDMESSFIEPALVQPRTKSVQKGVKKGAKKSTGKKRKSLTKSVSGATTKSTGRTTSKKKKTTTSSPIIFDHQLPTTATYLTAVSAVAPDLAIELETLNPKLRHTILSSSFEKAVTNDEMAEAINRVRAVVKDIKDGNKTVTVALLDLDARVGRLPAVIEVLNASQQIFTFLDLQAPVRAGLIIRSDRFDSWARHRAGFLRLTKKEREEFDDNLMFNDFYKYAQVVRRTSGVDYLIGITKYMVAGEEDGEYYWNYFSTGSKHVILASAYDLREYAQKAGRPFEVAVAGVALAQLIAEMNKKIDYHENRGCIFDHNPSRISIITSLKEARIEKKCLDLVDPKYRPAVEAMIAALRNYKAREEKSPEPPTKKKLKKHTDSYWLAQLNQLSEKLKKANNA